MAGRAKSRGPRQTPSNLESGLGRDSARNKLPSIIAYEEDEKESLAWKYLSLTQMIDLNQLTLEGVEERLREFLDLRECQISLKDGIILDYYVSGYWWAKEQNFTMKQISSFMTLLRVILDNVSNKRLPLTDNVKELVKVMSGNNQSSSQPNDVNFPNEESKAIINYIKISLFQHYKLYEFIFTQIPDTEILRTELEVELVMPPDPFPLPLEEGISWDIFASFVQLPLKDSELEDAQEHEESKDTTDITTRDRLASYTIDDVKLVLGQVTADVLGRVETEINEKLHKQEEAYSARIEKLKNP
ncbi:ciliary-associated calcium-binding coiled-coil protein 1 [Callorhinchus milii]|uniref:Ciliary-associated calcium-binding coiled-coil protein 1 n=1 Tax=Callorhinchus milii TaxID=7868 RepID=A0A4W3K7S6_CALMI|nr:ciliary-associated calcium-binding coiled-coil protein 1 [Callorhinchus milii]|eukprot:gi/632936569/ref/XP_007895369.1/ PREDICTED: uncharacterized protein C10orf107 homolog isoform X2 [Callorhinchus milii]